LAIRKYHWNLIEMASEPDKIQEQKLRESSHQQNSNIVHGVHPGMARMESNKTDFDDDGFQEGLDSAVTAIKEYFDRYL
jgi:hypothetical protein